ncbi:MAG: amidohydrolase family protein [Pseudomonadales bacterium]|nr:amidohydrolase family protein [Pseudomonadales bacterium]
MLKTAPSISYLDRQIASCLLALMILTACSPSPVQEDSATDLSTSIAIENVTVIDAENQIRENYTVIINGDAITHVGPSTKTPKAGTTIDGTDQFLIPGLWDMHVHLSYDDRFTDSMPATFLKYGITSVRDTGGLLKNMLPLVEKLKAEGAISPRVFFSGPLLDGRFVVYDGKSRPEIGTSNDNIQAARDNVIMLKKVGADFIKIYELVSPEVFAAMVDEANKQHMPIASHVPLSMTASSAGPEVGSMEHLRNVELDCANNSDELLRIRNETLNNYQPGSGYALRASLHKLQRIPAVLDLDEAQCSKVLTNLMHTIQVPTLRLNAFTLMPAFEREDFSEALKDMGNDVQTDWAERPTWFDPDPKLRDQRFAEYSMAMIKRMNLAGVPIGAGTDTPINMAIPGYSLHNELSMLVKAGLTPLQALRAATITPAEFFSLENEMGTIEVGKRADLVLLNENPLLDIRNTRKIDRVISKGKVVVLF